MNKHVKETKFRKKENVSTGREESQGEKEFEAGKGGEEKGREGSTRREL